MFEPLTARRPVLIPEVTDADVESLAHSPEHLRVLRALEIRSLIVVPLLARGRPLGAIALLSSRRSRHYGEPHLRLAQELARIAALTIGNALLYGSAQRAIAMRDEFMAIVAHDLRGWLGVILMQCELGGCRSGEGECTTGGGSEVIDRAADQMKHLIRDLLDVTSMEAGLLRVEQARVPAARIVTECVEAHRPLAASAALELAVEALPDLPDVWADRDRLSQVLENLVGNALKFTEPGGRVAVGARRQASDVEFWVSDTGEGIAEHDLPHVFDRFWQARRTERLGTGLGLPIAKGIVEAHGGRIWALSRLGAGSTFHFTVPVAASGAQRTAERPRPADGGVQARPRAS
jgi:signal transduction histidine kinase